MKEFIFDINNINAVQARKEYSLNKFDIDYIFTNYLPIIKLHSHNKTEIEKELEQRKLNFISVNQNFDIDIFNREELDFLVYEISEYINAFARGKNLLIGVFNKKYFHQFELTIDITNTKTLLISDFDIIPLEMYFKTIANAIKDFITLHRIDLQPKEKEKIRLEVPTFNANQKLSLRQIALIHYYQNKHITRDNADAVAKENGFSSKTSGEALYQKFSSYCSNADRKALPDTKKKIENKIFLFESILEYLSGNEKTKAIDELKIIKSKSEDL